FCAGGFGDMVTSGGESIKHGGSYGRTDDAPGGAGAGHQVVPGVVGQDHSRGRGGPAEGVDVPGLGGPGRRAAAGGGADAAAGAGGLGRRGGGGGGRGRP